jgi:NADP-dependent 3-hydroxy acid dehydrogenase YdfG
MSRTAKVDGKVVVITDAAHGIGSAAAIAVNRVGVKVAIRDIDAVPKY